MDTRPLGGKVAIVTGAARERGIGRAAAIRLAKDGASVVVTDIGRADAEGVDLGGRQELEETAELCRREGVPALALAMDVTSAEEIDACVAAAVREYGRLDVVFNNAGTPVGVGPFLEISAAQWDLSWRVNVLGMVGMIKAVVPHMREAGEGSIINNSSLAGLGAIPGLAAYTTTKFAVVGLTKSAACDFGPDNIRVNAVCPGAIDTQMGDREIDHLAKQWGIEREEVHARVSEDIPLGRRAQAEEVADAVAWLAGPHSRFVTGVAVPWPVDRLRASEVAGRPRGAKTNAAARSPVSGTTRCPHRARSRPLRNVREFPSRRRSSPALPRRHVRCGPPTYRVAVW